MSISNFSSLERFYGTKYMGKAAKKRLEIQYLKPVEEFNSSIVRIFIKLMLSIANR